MRLAVERNADSSVELPLEPFGFVKMKTGETVIPGMLVRRLFRAYWMLNLLKPARVVAELMRQSFVITRIVHSIFLSARYSTLLV